MRSYKVTHASIGINNASMKKLTSKHCTECDTLKPRSEFYISKRGNGEMISAVCKSCTMVRNAKRKHTPGALLAKARQRAKVSFIEFSITKGDITVPPRCPIFNTEWGDHLMAPSIDRIDNSKGYIPGNVVVVSWKANRMKNDSTIDELRTLVEWYGNVSGIRVER